MVALVLLATLSSVQLTAQQRPAVDSAKARRDTLETVVVKAVRATLATPAAQHTIGGEEIRRTYAGQDAPLFLTATPSVTSYSESGGFSGYSYIRLRGLDQSRINITFDGVPLNDPEDQVLYFSNVPDFLHSVESVQLQRGVGTSTFGTTSFAGSLNFQSIPLATVPRGGEVQLVAGSYGTAGLSTTYATGIQPNGFAAYARVSAQRTDGYRRHSGNDSKSTFLSAGWFGQRDAVKVSGFAGLSGTRLAYYAASEADLAVDRRVNPLSEAEGDRFHQEMVNVQYAHAIDDATRVTVTAYRNSAAGAYDVNFGTSMNNFFLGHTWYGALSTFSLRRGDLSLDLGAHVSDYHREHAMADRTHLQTRDYTNVGYKQEQSGFAKLAYDFGSLRLSGDLQLRRAAFQYHPSAGAGIGEASTSWSFLNPKIGATWTLTEGPDATTLFASYGRTSREPSRGDMFAGADDLNSTNAASILPPTRVRPETVNDFEMGANWTRGPLSASANLFAMEFRDEIAAIGQLSLTGSPLRKNVGKSYRRGVELDGSWQATPRLRATGNLTLMRSRIASYTDDASSKTYTDVEPLLTPAVLANQTLDFRASGRFSYWLTSRYVGKSQLANDGNATLVSPEYWMFDTGATMRTGRFETRAQLLNVADSKANAGGYTDGTARYFYPVAGRNVLVTVRMSF